jgi:cbb3-type cytochrome oxidase maturation protein
MTLISYILVFGLLGVFSASVVLGLWWAIRAGQFADFQRGATSIFDAEEPIGLRTDDFPERKLPKKSEV